VGEDAGAGEETAGVQGTRDGGEAYPDTHEFLPGEPFRGLVCAQLVAALEEVGKRICGCSWFAGGRVGVSRGKERLNADRGVRGL
jgi:hypothetical protein